jgi:hypothetical protein
MKRSVILGAALVALAAGCEDASSVDDDVGGGGYIGGVRTGGAGAARLLHGG